MVPAGGTSAGRGGSAHSARRRPSRPRPAASSRRRPERSAAAGRGAAGPVAPRGQRAQVAARGLARPKPALELREREIRRQVAARAPERALELGDLRVLAPRLLGVTPAHAAPERPPRRAAAAATATASTMRGRGARARRDGGLSPPERRVARTVAARARAAWAVERRLLVGHLLARRCGARRRVEGDPAVAREVGLDPGMRVEVADDVLAGGLVELSRARSRRPPAPGRRPCAAAGPSRRRSAGSSRADRRRGRRRAGSRGPSAARCRWRRAGPARARAARSRQAWRSAPSGAARGRRCATGPTRG